MILPQEALTGGKIEPVLPALAAALDTAALGSGHVRTVVATGKVSSPPGPDRPTAARKPQVVVYLHWDQLKSEASKAARESGLSLTTGQARRHLCDAKIIPVIPGSNSEIPDIGRANGTYTRKMPRAITARDRGCIRDGCDRPGDWCNIHQSQWTIPVRERRPTRTHPTTRWIDKTRTPRRNQLHHLGDLVDA